MKDKEFLVVAFFLDHRTEKATSNSIYNLCDKCKENLFEFTDKFKVETDVSKCFHCGNKTGEIQFSVVINFQKRIGKKTEGNGIHIYNVCDKCKKELSKAFQKFNRKIDDSEDSDEAQKEMNQLRPVYMALAIDMVNGTDSRIEDTREEAIALWKSKQTGANPPVVYERVRRKKINWMLENEQSRKRASVFRRLVGTKSSQ
jgi:hypothetical protein